MKIMLVLDWLDDGGAQIQALNLALEMQERGMHCIVVALYSAAGRGTYRGVETMGLGVPTRAAAFPLAFLRLLSLCRRERPDIVHSHAEAADLAGRLVSALLGLKHLATAHSEYPWHWRRGVGMALERSMAFLTSQYFAVSSAVAAMLREELSIPDEKIRMIPNWAPRAGGEVNGVPLPRRGVLTLLNVARLHVQKNQEILLSSFREVRKRCPEAVLWIAGSGPEEARLRSLAPEGVMFLGHRHDVPSLLRAADLFVLSSSWEGMPLSVLEAMREGLPVISTDVAGIGDIILHGDSGLVVPRGDAAALAEAILHCCEDPEHARRMGDAGQRFVHALEEQGIAAYAETYRGIAADLPVISLRSQPRP